MIALAYHCTVQNLKFLDLNGWFCIFFIVSRAILVARAPTPADVAAHPLVKVWIFPFLVVHLSIRAKDWFCISCSQVHFICILLSDRNHIILPKKLSVNVH